MNTVKERGQAKVYFKLKTIMRFPKLYAASVAQVASCDPTSGPTPSLGCSGPELACPLPHRDQASPLKAQPSSCQPPPPNHQRRLKACREPPGCSAASSRPSLCPQKTVCALACTEHGGQLPAPHCSSVARLSPPHLLCLPVTLVEGY